MRKLRITVSTSFVQEFEMIVSVPEGWNEEEYINDLLESILLPEVFEETVWDFVDGD